MAKSGKNSPHKPGTTVKISAKSPRMAAAADSGKSEKSVSKEGGLITFSPTGERIRITRTEKERIILDRDP